MIFGDGIRFRAPERSDLEMFVAWLNDPEVRFGLSLSLPLSMGEEEKWSRALRCKLRNAVPRSGS